MTCLLETGSVGEGSYAIRIASLQSGLQQAERENERGCKKGGNLVKLIQHRAADFWRFHIPSKKPKADSFPNLDAKRSVIHIVLSSQFFVVVYNGYINCG